LGDATRDMIIVPVNFNTEHKAMLGHSKMILESEGGRIAIKPDRFDKLITSLRIQRDNGKNKNNKEQRTTPAPEPEKVLTDRT
jgi:hypothetical protein